MARTTTDSSRADDTPLPEPAAPSRRGVSRRDLLTGGLVAGWGAAIALGVDSARRPAPTAATPAPEPLNGTVVVPFHGPQQAALTFTPQTHSIHTALDLRPGTDRAALARLMRLLTDDAARLTQGRPALADTEPEMATTPARLTVTFGFGPGFVAAAGADVPTWLAPLPAFSIDRLEERWSGGDLLVEVACDDPTVLAHAHRMLRKDARAFTTVRWVQAGFRTAHGTAAPGTTMRNLFGQVDGTVNPAPGSVEQARAVLRSDGWLEGGTTLVVRRIAMNLDTWDEVDRPGRDASVGRRMSDGAPLTGGVEHDTVDLDALDATGLPVVNIAAHVRRARAATPDEVFYRRAYNYESEADGAGLIFTTYQADPVRQLVPVQRRLAEADLLNTWTTPIGSAVFAIPPGCAPGGYVGETLLGGVRR